MSNVVRFIQDQAFLRSYDPATRSPPPPPPVSNLSLSFLVFLCVASPAYCRERGKGGGGGEEPNHTRRFGPL
jgi:hypothetical protein